MEYVVRNNERTTINNDLKTVYSEQIYQRRMLTRIQDWLQESQCNRCCCCVTESCGIAMLHCGKIGKMHAKNTYLLSMFCVFITFDLMRWGTWKIYRHCIDVFMWICVWLCVIICDCVHNGIAFVAMLLRRCARQHSKRSHLSLVCMREHSEHLPTIRHK